MDGFQLLLLWIASTFVATYLGYDRGRWLSGLMLGLLAGPLGALGAGFLPPSFEWEAERRHLVERRVRRLRKEDQARVQHRRQSKQDFDELIHALENQIEAQRLTFSDELHELAEQLEELSVSDPDQAKRVRLWIHWLNQKSDAVTKQSELVEEER